ncbi:hypothetical protein UA08_03427 [Talaromyces atroroseus]|uniref:Oxidoreductase n=1 Tax=Talaromyces atroroseus TaxID=1441469 RepID=A0A225AVB9_TALAT|nr:hypothetical protein UA08_03427 [Talaromyces atroroseus]OKL61248.1 hypothetical protein UA08_03427 [Talaromyces atroroseus]
MLASAKQLFAPSHYMTPRESNSDALRAETLYNRIDILDLDLASLDSVKKCADEFDKKENRLDLLFLNAGVASTPPALTQEGFEYQFGINHMGHALLTQLLVPKMIQTRQEDPRADVRIVATASNAAFAPFLPKGGLALNVMRQPDAYSPMGLYAHSKLANVLFIRKIAQIYPGARGVVSMLFKAVVWATAVDTDQGAKSQLWCGTAPLGGVTGVQTAQYYEPVGKSRMLKGVAADQKLTDELWEWTNSALASYGGKDWPIM